MPTKRKRIARRGRLSAETMAWLDSEDARLLFTSPETYAKRTRPPRAASHLPELRPWWDAPDYILGMLRGTLRLGWTPRPDAVAFVKLLEQEYIRRHGPAGARHEG